MLSWKDELSKKFIHFFQSVGIDPFLPMIFLMLLLSIRKIKRIKIWKELSPNEKRSDIIWWLLLSTIVLAFIVKTIRGE